MSDDLEKKAGLLDDREGPLTITLEAVPSTLKIAGGREINFTRAILVIRNIGLEPMRDLIPQATLVQEGGLPEDVTEALAKNLGDRPLPSGETLQWDLYDLLVAGHPGVASKVHLFGYKAVLNWWFDVSVQVEYGLSELASPLRTPIFTGRFRWTAEKSSLDRVDLAMESPPHPLP